MPEDLVGIVGQYQPVGDLPGRRAVRPPHRRRRPEPVQVDPFIGVVDDLGHMGRVEQRGDGCRADPGVAGGSQQCAEAPGPPVPGTPVLTAVIGPGPDVQRQPSGEESRVVQRELRQFGRGIEPDHRPVAVDVEPHRTEVARPREPREPVPGDREQLGALRRADRPHALAQPFGKVRCRPEPLDLRPWHAAATGRTPVDLHRAGRRPRHRTDDAQVDREPELVPAQLQFPRCPRLRHQQIRHAGRVGRVGREGHLRRDRSLGHVEPLGPVRRVGRPRQGRRRHRCRRHPCRRLRCRRPHRLRRRHRPRRRHRLRRRGSCRLRRGHASVLPRAWPGACRPTRTPSVMTVTHSDDPPLALWITFPRGCQNSSVPPGFLAATPRCSPTRFTSSVIS